jgi:DNA topoisomerase 2-associated protein PAT1
VLFACSFNTSLHNEEALHRLAQKQRAAREDADVYDFQSLRDELGDEDEINDGLGDQLEEVGDDLNDETFGADDIGKKAAQKNKVICNK